MNDFVHVLRKAELRLRAPEPQRSRIMLELAHDLDALYLSYRERGYSEGEARARAERFLDASDEALEALAEVHAPALSRLLTRFSDDDRYRAERLLLTVLALFAVLLGASTLATTGLLRAPSPLLWPLLLLVALSAWAIGLGTIRLFLAAYRPPTVFQLQPLLGLAGASLALGLLAVLTESWRLASRIEATGSAGVDLLMPHLFQTSGIFTLSLTLSLAILLAWFHLRRRAREIEAVRLAASCLTRSSQNGGEPWSSSSDPAV